VVILAIAGWLYSLGHKAGKREGSRKGYGVGFSRGRRSRAQSGCMIVLAVFGLIATATGVAVAHIH
jgi:hypothetical protein